MRMHAFILMHVQFSVILSLAVEKEQASSKNTIYSFFDNGKRWFILKNQDIKYHTLEWILGVFVLFKDSIQFY